MNPLTHIKLLKVVRMCTISILNTLHYLHAKGYKLILWIKRKLKKRTFIWYKIYSYK